MSDALRRERGPVRVQRVPDTWPVVHLEASPPPVDALAVAGMVRHPLRLSLDDLRALGEEEQSIPVHCVWGWSKPAVRWTGVRMGKVLAVAEPSGTYVVVSSASGVYSSCLPRDAAAAGFLAWGRDGDPLDAEAGGPIRFVAPPTYWAYKHVKWSAAVRVVDRFSPGFWESKVADPVGLVPGDVVLP